MSTDNFYVQDRSALKRYLVIVGFLGLVLLGMLFLYNLLNKPPEVKGDNNPKGLTSLFSIYGFEGDRLNRPTGVTTDANGNIYVADSEKHRILLFDSNGTFVEQFGDAGQKKYELWYPNAVAVADNGQVFVACKQSNRIVIFNA
ncbi:MAG: 6-bladed beta-propeller, partial [Candidatus Aquicultor sp.]